MKTRVLVYCFLITCFACAKKESVQNDSQTPIEERSLLKTQIDSTIFDSIDYKQFQTNLDNEYIISPDSTIAAYNEIIRSYPNSPVKDRAELRIKHIAHDIKFWDKQDGWRIEKDGVLKKPNDNAKTKVCE